MVRTGYAKGFFVRNKSIFAMGLTALFIAGTADLFAGLLLDQMEDMLYEIVGMMVLIYCAIGMRGNIFGAMGSRIGTAMHMGTFQMNFHKGGVLRANVEAALCLTMTLSMFMGITTWTVAMLFFDGENTVWDFIFISSLGGLLAGMLVMLFNILIAREGYKRDWDVDNITAPLIAAIGDIVTMPMIFFSTIAFKALDETSAGNLAVMALALLFVAVSVIYLARILTRKANKRDFSGEAKRVVINSTPTLLFCLVFEIAAGIVIQNEQDRLISYSVLLIMMPAFLNEGNALSGMLTSRLSSMLHLGTMRAGVAPPRVAWENFAIIYVCAVLTFAYIGFISCGATVLFSEGLGNLGLFKPMLVILIAGVIATTILNFLSYYIAMLATRFGLDPDDHCIPVTSSVMDMAGAIVIMAVVSLFI